MVPKTGMESPGVEQLREHLRRHNQTVLGLTLLTSGAAIALWTGLYLVVWWLFLLGGSAVHPMDFHPGAGALVRGFGATAVCLCLFAWISRRLRPNEAPRDHKGLGENLMDVILAVPRVTLAIFGTGAAAARLSDRELDEAWRLLKRMDEENKPLPMQTLPVDFPDSRTRDKIVLALQLSGLIEIRPTSGGPVLAFQNAEARRLAQEKVRLRF
jgi:hypothetical protein